MQAALASMVLKGGFSAFGPFAAQSFLRSFSSATHPFPDMGVILLT
jgi:hypothetical protein